MAKRKTQKSPSNRAPWLMIAIATVIGVIVIGLFLTRGTSVAAAPAISELSPQQYISDFANTSRPHLLLDVRTPEEFASGHIAGAVNIAVESLESRLSEVPQGQPVVVYCRSGNRSATASQILKQAGYTNIFDMGGINAWQSAGLPIE